MMIAFKRFVWKLVISGIILYMLAIRFADVSLGIPVGQHPLEAGWAKTGLLINEISLEGWDCINDRFETEEQLVGRMNRLVKKLDLKMDEDPLIGGDKGFRYINVSGRTSEGGHAIVILQSIDLGTEGETHLGFVLNDFNHGSQVQEIIARYSQILQENGMKKALAISIEGQTPGRLTDAQIEDLFGRCFKALKANRVDGGFIDDYRNWRGKSSLLQEAKASAGGINLEVSAVYDIEQDVTCVTLSSPSLQGT